MTEKTETLPELMARLDREYAIGTIGNFESTVKEEWLRIVEAFTALRGFVEGVSVACGKEDEQLARDLLARIDRDEL